jgi:hypothetical protein
LGAFVCTFALEVPRYPQLPTVRSCTQLLLLLLLPFPCTGAAASLARGFNSGMLRRPPQRLPLKQEDIDEVDAVSRGVPRPRPPGGAHPSAFTAAAAARAVVSAADAFAGGGGGGAAAPAAARH